MATLRHENIGRLDVAVNDTGRVCGIQSVRNFYCKGEKGLGFNWTSADLVLERDSIQKLHHKKEELVLLSDLVNGADIGMIQGRRGSRFATESLQSLGIPGHFVRKELESDESSKFGVFCLVDDTHPTTPKFFDDPVVRDGLANHWAES